MNENEGSLRRFAALRSALTPILSFLEDDTVLEVMLNADGTVWVDRAGRGMWCSQVRMAPADALRLLRLIAAEMDLELNAANPSLAAKLPHWNARVQGAIPPIVEAPVFAMRKPAKVIFSLEDYVRQGVLNDKQLAVLVDAVEGKQNILIGGGTGTGKTTLANALLKAMATTGDRLLLVEDNPELQCDARNRIQVLLTPPRYTAQRAIVDAMRLRPDRIIVGEVRDGAALELLKAWNTGHPGGVATIHANDTRSMLDRICQLIEEVVCPAPRAMVAQAVSLCVHLQRDRAHRAGRRVSGIDRILGWSPNNGWDLETCC